MKLDKIKHFFRLPSKEYAIKTSKKYLLILIISVFISMFFMKNLQPSLPLGIYMKIFSRNYKKGDIVIINLDRKYHKYFNKKGVIKYVMKKITADYNDTVSVSNSHIYVNNQDYGQIENLSIPVPDLKIKKGCFFVLSTQPGSFDSRYFGQVCEKDIKYKAIPFITF
jgi:conjugative transfer signal peptidase TraF